MKTALSEAGLTERFSFTETPKTFQPLGMPALTLQAALNPRNAFIKKIAATIILPTNTAPAATFDKVMAHPDLPKQVSKYLLAKDKICSCPTCTSCRKIRLP